MPKLLNAFQGAFFGLILLAMLRGITACQPSSQQQMERSSPIEALTSTADTAGFARALEPRVFHFPEDAGPHPEFQTEWWYYTGHLHNAAGRRFGYQLTFFRRGLAPKTVLHLKDWPTEQMYFAHFTVSDIENQRFYPFERWQRGSIELAGAQAEPFAVWLDHWRVAGDPEGEVTLEASAAGVDLNLRLQSLKPAVLQGEQGLSQKSAGVGNASYYYSRTRLASEGTLRLPDESQELSVRGTSWLDREWSTSVLSQKQAGWDWFSLHLPGNQELMLYQLRLKSGGVDSFSSGTFVNAEGKSTHLKVDDFSIEPTANWRSPETGITYPSGWVVKVPAQQLELHIEPLMKNQELPLSFVYWEGAVQVRNAAGESLGEGYVELTGYD